MYTWEVEKKEEIDGENELHSTGSLPKCLPWWELGWVGARSQELRSSPRVPGTELLKSSLLPSGLCISSSGSRIQIQDSSPSTEMRSMPPNQCLNCLLWGWWLTFTGIHMSSYGSREYLASLFSLLCPLHSSWLGFPESLLESTCNWILGASIIVLHRKPLLAILVLFVGTSLF